jgi:hypothetical protein
MMSLIWGLAGGFLRTPFGLVTLGALGLAIFGAWMKYDGRRESGAIVAAQRMELWNMRQQATNDAKRVSALEVARLADEQQIAQLIEQGNRHEKTKPSVAGVCRVSVVRLR